MPNPYFGPTDWTSSAKGERFLRFAAGGFYVPPRGGDLRAPISAGLAHPGGREILDDYDAAVARTRELLTAGVDAKCYGYREPVLVSNAIRFGRYDEEPPLVTLTEKRERYIVVSDRRVPCITTLEEA